ncbi:MAG: acyl-CoA dehydrogenase family protein [Chloroflexi bacterium]|nr:acyl-CoA dehydrogenase family protein [Chloroflexota bacterium]
MTAVHSSPSPTDIGIGFDPTAEQRAVRDRIAAFVAQDVVPHEPALLTPAGVSWQVVQELRQRARAAGVYGPTLQPDLSGLGLDWRGVAIALEEAGTSLLGPLALNCAAPDEGNMHLLGQVSRPDQRERYLRPLAAGEIRSCFAMTEPAPGAGADPSMLCTRARRDGDDWVIDGAKWYITGADGAAFAIVMARTSDDPDPRRGATMFLVDAGTPGFEIVRHIPSLDRTFPGGHCELRFTDCRVPADAVLGEVDRGFDYAQVRLVPARLTHCMRWLGLARRAQEIAAGWATERTGGGKPLGEHQMVQAMLADSQIDLQAARLMIWHACWLLDQGHPARGESSMAKVFVAEAVNRVVDRAIQVCGALGISEDLPLSLFYREVRAFRIYDGPSEVHRAAIARRVLRSARARREAPGDGSAR